MTTAKKNRKSLEAWREALQRDLDRKNELLDANKQDEFEYARICYTMQAACELLKKRYDVLISYSYGKQVVIEPRINLEGIECI